MAQADDSLPSDHVLADAPFLPASTSVAESNFVLETLDAKLFWKIIHEVYVEVVH